jgi:hypothetical protein
MRSFSATEIKVIGSLEQDQVGIKKGEMTGRSRDFYATRCCYVIEYQFDADTVRKNSGCLHYQVNFQ